MLKCLDASRELQPRLAIAAALLALALPATGSRGQTSPASDKSSALRSTVPAMSGQDHRSLASSADTSSARALFDFQDSEIKFRLAALMAMLRDRQHEGWVLAAYPDPKTGRPLIGAGFSLDVPATDHPQLDPLNPHPFLEPSSAQLWQAAGLAPERLQAILEQFDRNLQAWTKKGYRRRIRANRPAAEVTEAEATSLLSISAIQAIHNARAYCRNFDELNGSQQMALSQLVFQMGTNLEEFVDFLAAINGDPVPSTAASAGVIPVATDGWNSVQRALIESQWARGYRTRASSVIAMFDPEYERDPDQAERRVAAVLRPPTKHHHKARSRGSFHAAKASDRGSTKASSKRS